ncbi:hypothetical protein LWF15_24270 [Kineosporia rhizophila]|uniref:hypothetical protein n=1 Tax=Kineosporia rhizophila TaxID=84633 RepID=UPI001E564120|nr:hypothetical protein [Kineosporia rhizophila]MCE0538619.1 hypothetical protein [Kineosporia rhizophila]
MRALRLYLRALGAAAVLALMLFGTPVLLWALIGNPLPAWDALQVGDFSDDVLLHILATIAWIGWASLVLTVVVEARAHALERPAPALPVLPGQQDFTRSLLAALLLAAPTLAVTATAIHQPGILPDSGDPARPGTTTGQAAHHASPEHHDSTHRQATHLQAAPISRQTPRADTPADTGADTRAPVVRSHPASSPQQSSPAQAYLLGTASGIGVSLAAAGLHTIVVRRRRQERAARQPGRLPDLPTPDATRVERHLVTSAWLAQALRERLAAALHHLDTALRAEGRESVVFLAARLDAERTELVPTRPMTEPPPPPWDVDPDSGHWILKDGAVLEEHHGRLSATQPANHGHRWAWIGSSTPTAHQQRPSVPDETDVWLLNLTAAASIRIFGEPDQTADLARAILLSQAPQVPAASTGPAHTVTIHTDAHDLTELGHLIDADTAPATHQPSSALIVVDQRRRPVGAPPSPVAAAVGATTIVLTDDLGAIRDENVRLVIDRTGSLHLSFTKPPITSALITRRDIDWISPLLSATHAGASRRAPWAIGQDERPQPALRSAPNPYSLPSPAGDDTTPTAASIEALNAAPASAPATEDPGPAPGQGSDAALDADLRLWYADDTTRPRLRLLGPVEVRAAGKPRPGDRIPWQTEIVALFHAYPHGLTMGEFTDKMWPHDADRKAASAMPRQAISGVRHWLGIDPDTGQHYLPKLPPRDADARYRINHLLTDADLASRLYQRATSTQPPNIQDLQAALDLVTGPVLDERRPAGYLWLLDTLLEAELTALVSDIAHALAEHWLTHARPDLATSAAKVALTAGSGDDTTYLDLIAAAEASGHPAQAGAWLRQLLQIHDAETENDLPPPTLNRLTRLRRTTFTGP